MTNYPVGTVLKTTDVLTYHGASDGPWIFGKGHCFTVTKYATHVNRYILVPQGSQLTTMKLYINAEDMSGFDIVSMAAGAQPSTSKPKITNPTLAGSAPRFDVGDYVMATEDHLFTIPSIVPDVQVSSGDVFIITGITHNNHVYTLLKADDADKLIVEEATLRKHFKHRSVTVRSELLKKDPLVKALAGLDPDEAHKSITCVCGQVLNPATDVSPNDGHVVCWACGGRP